MLYRRKILLALVEAFGGWVSQSSCRRLLLLFCLQREKSYYDFFPYHGENWSLTLLEDKQRLTSLGILVDHQDFQLQHSQSYLAQLASQDRTTLQALVSLARAFYSQSFSSKLEAELPSAPVDSKEISQADLLAVDEHTSRTSKDMTSPCLFTLGYEGLSIDAYLGILTAYQVTLLIDVRRNPISRKYGFSKRQLACATEMAGIAYVHLPNLGIPSDMRRNLGTTSSYEHLFAYYSTDMLPQQTETIEQLKLLLKSFGRVTLTCFEADYEHCHRHKVVEYLQTNPKFTMPVVHLNKASPLPIQKKHSLVEQIFHGLLEEKVVYSSL